MSKTQYPTKYQITKLELRVDEELDPVINLAELELKAVLTEETENAMTYLAKKIKADTVIDNLQKAVEQLEIAQRQAVTFFGKIKDNNLKENLNYKFREKDNKSNILLALVMTREFCLMIAASNCESGASDRATEGRKQA